MCVSVGRSLVAVMLLASSTAFAQVDLKPTPAPTITAESAAWYQSKEPIVFAGNTYYPAGPQDFFDANEMVRSGYYRGVPIYTRTTEEPNSKVYVSLAEKLMQPYERRREGELAGTVGSSTPSFPVQRSAETAPTTTEPLPAVTAPVAPPAAPPAAPRRTVAPASKTSPGKMAVFIEYGGRRWFSSGATVEYSPSRFNVIGTYHDLPVYADRTDTSGTIYIPIEKSVNALLAPYRRKP